jgi:hypothetical protein
MNAAEPPIRVWTNPNVKDEPSLVHLTAETLTLATIPAAELEARARQAASAHAVDGQVIRLADVTRLDGSQDGADIILHFRHAEEKTAKATAALTDTETRNQVLDAVETRLGRGWERVEEPEDRIKTLLGTVAGVAFFGFLTWLAHQEAQDAEAGKPMRHGGGKGKLFDLAVRGLTHVIGATGVLIVFSLVCVLIGFFGLKAVISPGMRIVLRRIEDR